MFDAVARRSTWPLVALVAAAALGGSWLVPDRARRAALLLAGVAPWASPAADRREDQPLTESPLTTSLELEAALTTVDRGAALAFADELARQLGFWLMENTGSGDVHEAERALWARDGDPDALVEAWSAALQDREVYARTIVPGLWSGVPELPPIYVHPDELPLLLMHVAWRLDLRAELVRSPIHLYVQLREPGGERVRGVEPTCFRLFERGVEGSGQPEPSVGRALVFEPDHFSSGRGGIRNPEPLPKGAYEVISPAELPGELLARVAARHDVDPARLEERLVDSPGDAALAKLAWRRRLSAGLSAWEAGDLARVRVEAAGLGSLRRLHGALLPEEPDERVLDAIIAFDSGDPAEGRAALRAIFAHWEPDGPVEVARSDAHLAAMWLELEYGSPTLEDWNARVVPLLNRYHADHARLVRLCALGRDVLRGAVQTVEELVPECAKVR